MLTTPIPLQTIDYETGSLEHFIEETLHSTNVLLAEAQLIVVPTASKAHARA